jgi:hypothetical protein
MNPASPFVPPQPSLPHHSLHLLVPPVPLYLRSSVPLSSPPHFILPILFLPPSPPTPHADLGQLLFSIYPFSWRAAPSVPHAPKRSAHCLPDDHPHRCPLPPFPTIGSARANPGRPNTAPAFTRQCHRFHDFAHGHATQPLKETIPNTRRSPCSVGLPPPPTPTPPPHPRLYHLPCCSCQPSAEPEVQSPFVLARRGYDFLATTAGPYDTFSVAMVPPAHPSGSDRPPSMSARDFFLARVTRLALPTPPRLRPVRRR